MIIFIIWFIFKNLLIAMTALFSLYYGFFIFESHESAGQVIFMVEVTNELATILEKQSAFSIDHHIGIHLTLITNTIWVNCLLITNSKSVNNEDIEINIQ